ncbi:hypothetical protein P43SY_008120 [Pythium insidiosum]|uniref:AMMECR1 domain-containing protein n=1 Tax=Pythium insidiosum TaxID=114742 RepID=A0AAD5LJ56_PYTIN|nr:hypothetical protein P43SY_008120 [Pythium insidiosum]
MASAAMVAYCFDTLRSHLHGEDEPTPSFDVQQSYPLFVTWEIERAGGERHLRGCIGTLTPTKLRNLREFTFKSALKDRRFDPINAQELHKLHCSVSLLIDYEDAAHYEDWEIGVHGIIIDFEDEHGQHYSATYLPDVAKEQNWTHVEAVVSLMRKAGFRRSVTQTLLGAVRLTRYKSSKHKLSFQEYLAFKERAGLAL